MNSAKVLAISLLVISYPYLTYKGLDLGLGWLFPLIMAAVFVFRALPRSNRRTNKLLLGVALLIGLSVLFMQSATAKIVPVGIYIFLCWLFGRTLKQGPSLIERMVRMEYPDFPPGVVEYCRQLTWIWTVFFAINSTLIAILAIQAPAKVWAIYTGIVIFVLMAALMIGEYFWRLKRFPDLDISPPRASMESMVRNGRQLWQDMF